MHKCPKCGGLLFFDQENGEYVCTKGHVVMEHLVDEKREWKAGDREEVRRRSRVGAPAKYSDPNPYSTLIGWGSINSDEERMVESAKRLRRLHIRVSSTDPKVKRKNVVIEIIKEIASQLNLPEVVIEEASRMYSIIDRRSALKNRRIAPLALALLYYASRLHGLTRSINEFLEAGSLWLGSNKDKLRKSVRKYYMILKDNSGREAVRLSRVSSRQAILNYISRYSSILKISTKSEMLAKDIAKQIEKSLMLGRDPKGFAAAMLNLACNILNEDVKQSELSRVSEISTVTIRKRKKEILENHVINVYVRTTTKSLGAEKGLIGSTNTSI